MGLGTVELVMDVEDRFKIRIDDADAEHICTVGDLHAYICRKLSFNSPRRCPTRSMFYRVRREIAERMNIPRTAIHPRHRIDWLFPTWRSRQRVWRELRAAEVTLPTLRMQPMAAAAVAILAMVSFVAICPGPAFVMINPSAPMLLGFLIAALGGAVGAFLIGFVARPFSATPPDGCETVAGLVRSAVLHDKTRPVADAGDVWSAKGVYEELRSILVEQGVKPEAIRPEAHLITDLDLD